MSPQEPVITFFSFDTESISPRVTEMMVSLNSASAAAETIDALARSIEQTSNTRSRLVFTHVLQSGYRRAEETGSITGHRLQLMDRLAQPFESIYQRSNCWGEIHSIDRFRPRWQKLQRLFFSVSSDTGLPAKNYVVFTHGNLLSSIITFLSSGASDYRWQFGNHAPHCSVSILSYTCGDLLPVIVRSPFQVLDRTLPLTINNVNPRKMKLEEILSLNAISDPSWSHLVDTVIPERVVGCHTDQLNLVSKAIPANDDEARRIWWAFKQYHSRMITKRNRRDLPTPHDDSEDEDDEGDSDTNSINAPTGV